MKVYIIFALLCLLMVGSCAKKQPQTVEITLPPFGNYSKAEFYPIEPDPQRSGAEFVMHRYSAEVFYVRPRVLLNGTHLSAVDIEPSDTTSGLKKVVIRVNDTGKVLIRGFIQEHSRNHPIVLIWENQVHSMDSASAFLSNVPVIIADPLQETEAAQLRDALQ